MSPQIFEGYARVIVAGACFTSSLLYLIWKARGVTFKNMKLKLRYETHERGHLIDLYYACEGSWSKVLRDRERDGESTLTKMVLSSVDVTRGERIAYMANLDVEGQAFAEVGVQLPNTPHGRNDFQDIRHVAILSALNPSPAHFKWLEKQGISPDEVRDAGFRQSAYQAIMRIAIRNPDDLGRKTVIVPDRDTAIWLSDLFKGAVIRQLPGFSGFDRRRDNGRPRTHKDEADKKRTYRREQKLLAMAQLDVAEVEELKSFPYVLGNMSRKSPYISLSGQNQSIDLVDNFPSLRSWGSAYLAKDSADLQGYFLAESDDEFISQLHLAWTSSISNKESSGLLSPATFDPHVAGTSTRRGLDNVRYLRGLWLDFDGGDMTPEIFADIFGRLRVVCFNTFRSKADAIRWRAFIPTSCAMTREVHERILRRIVDIMREYGYETKDEKPRRGRPRQDQKRHGLDMSKITASSLFYLPAQAENPADSFWTDFNDARRGPLDPYRWAERMLDYGCPEPDPIVDEPPAHPTVDPGPSRAVSAALQGMREAMRDREASEPQRSPHAPVQAALEAWRLDGTVRGHGHEEFWRLACRLSAAGLQDDEIRDHLNDAAREANNPAERRREIDRIIVTLRKRRQGN